MRPSDTDNVDSALAAAESTRRLSYEASPLPSIGDVKFSWLGNRPLGGATVAGSHRDYDSGDLLRSGAPNTTSKDELGPTSSRTLSRVAAAAAMALSPHRSGKQGAGRSLLPPSSSREQQRARVATALDRMGAGVIEVREAFQRWVPGAQRAPAMGPQNDDPGHSGRQARPAKPLVGSSNHRVKALGSAKATIIPEASTMGVADLNGGVSRAMQELRLPLETAAAFCQETAGGGVEAGPPEELSFSEFVSRYAGAAGLLTESPAHGREGGEVWVEGPGGRWVAISRRKSECARRVFDEQAAEQEQQDTKSDDGGT